MSGLSPAWLPLIDPRTGASGRGAVADLATRVNPRTGASGRAEQKRALEERAGADVAGG